VHHPLLYFPCFYALKEVVSGGSVENGLRRYAKNYREDLTALWKIWVPSTIINFSFMPMALRIPWVASTSLIWTCVISAMRGANDAELDANEAMNMTGAPNRALSRLYDLGVAAKPAFTYDHTKAHLLFMATGRDRIGFIDELTRTVDGARGNVIDLKAYKVGREFVTIMLVDIEPSSAQRMVGELEGLGGRGMQVAVQQTRPWASDEEGDSPRCRGGVSFTGHLRATGPDGHGIVHKITALLADARLDITSLTCNQHQQLSLSDDASKPTTQQLFQLTGVVRAFDSFGAAERRRLQEAVLDFERREGIRLAIEETEPDPSFSAFVPAQTAGEAGGRKLAKAITKRIPAIVAGAPPQQSP